MVHTKTTKLDCSVYRYCIWSLLATVYQSIFELFIFYCVRHIQRTHWLTRHQRGNTVINLQCSHTLVCTNINLTDNPLIPVDTKWHINQQEACWVFTSPLCCHVKPEHEEDQCFCFWIKEENPGKVFRDQRYIQHVHIIMSFNWTTRALGQINIECSWILTLALENWLQRCSLKSEAGILKSWELKTLRNNL